MMRRNSSCPVNSPNMAKSSVPVRRISLRERQATCASPEGPPQLQPDLKLDDTVPFRLSRNHFMIEKRDGSYYVRDLCSTLGTIVNGEPIGNRFRGDEAPLQAAENEVIAGGVDSAFVFSLVISRQQRRL